GFSSTDIRAVVLLDYCLSAAKMVRFKIDIDLVSPSVQFTCDIHREAVFHIYTQPFHKLPSRRIQGALGIHAVINEIHRHLQMTLRLHKSTHDTEWPDRFLIFRDETRNNRME